MALLMLLLLHEMGLRVMQRQRERRCRLRKRNGLGCLMDHRSCILRRRGSCGLRRSQDTGLERSRGGCPYFGGHARLDVWISWRAKWRRARSRRRSWLTVKTSFEGASLSRFRFTSSIDRNGSQTFHFLGHLMSVILAIIHPVHHLQTRFLNNEPISSIVYLHITSTSTFYAKLCSRTPATHAMRSHFLVISRVWLL